MKLPSVLTTLKIEANRSSTLAGLANGLGALNGLFADFMVMPAADAVTPELSTHGKTTGKSPATTFSSKSANATGLGDLDVGQLIAGQPDPAPRVAFFKPSLASPTWSAARNSTNSPSATIDQDSVSLSLQSDSPASIASQTVPSNADDATRSTNPKLDSSPQIAELTTKTKPSVPADQSAQPTTANPMKWSHGSSAESLAQAPQPREDLPPSNTEPIQFEAHDGSLISSLSTIRQSNDQGSKLSDSLTPTGELTIPRIAESDPTIQKQAGTDSVFKSMSGDIALDGINPLESPISPSVWALMATATPSPQLGFANRPQAAKSNATIGLSQSSAANHSEANRSAQVQSSVVGTDPTLTTEEPPTPTDNLSDTNRSSGDGASTTSWKDAPVHPTSRSVSHRDMESTNPEANRLESSLGLVGTTAMDVLPALRSQTWGPSSEMSVRGNSTAVASLDGGSVAKLASDFGSIFETPSSEAASESFELPSAIVESPALLDSVAAQIATSVEGTTEWLNIEIHPQELGRLEIRVAQVNDRLVAQIVATNEQTSAWLDRERQSLQEFLASHGLDLGQVEIFHRQSDSSSEHSDSNRSQPEESQPEFTQAKQLTPRSSDVPPAIHPDLGLNRSGINILV